MQDRIDYIERQDSYTLEEFKMQQEFVERSKKETFLDKKIVATLKRENLDNSLKIQRMKGF